MPKHRKHRRAAKSPDRSSPNCSINDPREVQRMFEDAVRHQQAGRLDDAAAGYRRILSLQPDLANAHNNLGGALAALGSTVEATACYERAIALNPDQADAHYNLGNAFRTLGRRDDAAECYRRAIFLRPDFARTWNNLGIVLHERGQIDDAVMHYERALDLDPDYADAHNNLGLALIAGGRVADALTHYERALILNPDHADAHNNVGATLKDWGRLEGAIAHYRRALVLNPGHADAQANLGTALNDQGKLDDAIANYRRALALNPNHAIAHQKLGIALKDQGNLDGALEHYRQAIAIRPDYAEAHFNRAQVKSFRRGDPDLAALEALAGRQNLSAHNALYLNFALAKALEDSGDHLRAFEHFRKGNTVRRGQINYDEASVLELFRRISTVFDSRLFDRFKGEGNPSAVPVFVLGMPRSGSTLIEQILASHPRIHGAGELTNLETAARSVLTTGNQPDPYPESVSGLSGGALRQIARSYLDLLPPLAGGKKRITDKMPGNFLMIGLIRLILPNARIIHTVRNPIDTCVSCYSKPFVSGHLDFSYDLGELGRYYRGYSELMAHWRNVLPPDAMLDVAYEDVVDDLEGQARRLIDYCGLPWDDRCLDFHHTSRPVSTASAVQVRQPLFRSSLQRWRKYEAGLGPLLRELKSVMPEPVAVRARAAGAGSLTASSNGRADPWALIYPKPYFVPMHSYAEVATASNP